MITQSNIALCTSWPIRTRQPSFRDDSQWNPKAERSEVEEVENSEAENSEAESSKAKDSKAEDSKAEDGEDAKDEEEGDGNKEYGLFPTVGLVLTNWQIRGGKDPVTSIRRQSR